MLGTLKHLAERWTKWLGDRDLEIAIRNKLSDEGYFGDSASINELRLAAVQRPGWLQIFTFSAEARPAASGSPRLELAGLVRQDERYNRADVRLFQLRTERNKLFESWSEDLIKLRRLG